MQCYCAIPSLKKCAIKLLLYNNDDTDDDYDDDDDNDDDVDDGGCNDEYDYWSHLNNSIITIDITIIVITPIINISIIFFIIVIIITFVNFIFIIKMMLFMLERYIYMRVRTTDSNFKRIVILDLLQVKSSCLCAVSCYVPWQKLRRIRAIFGQNWGKFGPTSGRNRANIQNRASFFFFFFFLGGLLSKYCMQCNFQELLYLYPDTILRYENIEFWARGQEKSARVPTPTPLPPSPAERNFPVWRGFGQSWPKCVCAPPPKKNKQNKQTNKQTKTGPIVYAYNNLGHAISILMRLFSK